MRKRSRYLKVVRKFCSSSISWVHGDENGTGGFQHELHPLKHKPVHLQIPPKASSEGALKFHTSIAQENLQPYNHFNIRHLILSLLYQ